MSRSGYTDDCENLGLWRGTVERSLRGKRGQAFLHELASAMDAMPEKRLVAGHLEENGQVCTIGVVGKERGIDMSKIDQDDSHQVGQTFNISPAMAAEIVYENDEREDLTPESRWHRMRKWVQDNIPPKEDK